MDCVHHWMIESSGTPNPNGVCCKCGEQKEFPSIVPTRPFVWSKVESIEITRGRRAYMKGAR